MKCLVVVSMVAFVVVAGAAAAQTSDKAIKDNPGYKSGASDSGKSGMDSSRGVATTPTAGRPGTVENGDPSVKPGPAH